MERVEKTSVKRMVCEKSMRLPDPKIYDQKRKIHDVIARMIFTLYTDQAISILEKILIKARSP
jgi:hypothetical protein